MHVNRCYECSNDLCDDCCLRHNEITETEYHTFQSSNDTMLLNNIYTVSDRIRDTKALPSGLLVTASDSREMLLTHNASDAHQNEINVFARPCSIAILDRNTVAVLVTQTYKKVESITIVDIRRRQVIQHVNMTPHLSCEQFRPMFCINDQLYTSGICQITVTDMSGTKVREIYLEFTPIDMCYDVKADRVYCIDYSGDRLWCIDRDGNTIFTLTEPSLLNSERLALDSEGYVLILCRADYDFKEFVVFRISPEGDSSEVIITGKQFDEFYSLSSCLSICFDVESDSVVIGIEDRLYFYKANRVN